MPTGYPNNPELARQRRSIAQKNRIRSKEWHGKVKKILVKRNKSPEHIGKVKKALTGVKHTPERKKNQSLNHANFNGKRNPNWRGANVGRIGVHIWLKKFFKKTNICECCGKKQENGTDYALIKGKQYKRKRENFKELCRPCHFHYDGNLHGIKLTKKEVIKIRKIYYSKKISYKELSRQFNISDTTIRDILIRKTWKHI